MNKETQNKNVLIVGAGFTGLGTAKYCLEEGLEPFILEQRHDIGGIWNPESGHSWSSMTTNLSKFNVAYKDFPWPEDAPMFPRSIDFYRYIKDYAEVNNLSPYINFNCELMNLTKVHKDGQVQYQAIWKQKTGAEKCYVFPYVALAAGIFAAPFYARFEGLEKFKGRVIHSADYKSGQEFHGQKIITFGSSYTGIELTSDLSKYCQKVTHCYRMPFWVLPHYLQVSETRKIPIDAALFTRSYHKLPQMTHEDSVKYLNKICHSFCKQQQQVQKLKISEEDLNKPVAITISSHYLDGVRQGVIDPIKYRSVEFTENGVIVNGGLEEPIDAVVMCTGYENTVSFLDAKIKEGIEYDEQQPKQPYILYKEIAHPDYPNLMFLGMYKAVQIPACELHAQLAAKVFAGKIALPDRDKMLKGMKEQRRFRTLSPQPQAPHMNYIDYNDDIAQLLGQSFDLQELKQISYETYEQFIQLPALQTQYYYNTEKIEEQIHYISKILERMSLPV